jgi:predicted ATP-grasp superfamily ATP-dependent carboligase
VRILVLDGNQNQAVACVRSLGRKGHRVLVGEATSWSKAGWSRYSAGSFQYSSPEKHPEIFLQDLLDHAANEAGTLVLPMTEKTSLLVSAARERFAKAHARTVLPDHGDLLRAVDKASTTALAQSLGITVPKTYVIDHSTDDASLADQLSFPIVLKPRTSEESQAGTGTRATGRPAYASNMDAMRRALSKMRRHCSTVLAQEYIEGSGSGYFALMNQGELRAEFAHRRIRDVHPTGSGSALRESIVPPANIREASLAMLRNLRWHGVAMVEYRIRTDGTPVFLEINGRFWHSLALACYAGVDFPALLAELAEHRDVTPPTPYKIGVRCRWFVGDFRHLVEVWKGPPPGYPGVFPGRLNTLFSELTPRRGTFHDNFMWQDPLPEVGDWIRFGRQILDRNSR